MASDRWFKYLLPSAQRALWATLRKDGKTVRRDGKTVRVQVGHESECECCGEGCVLGEDDFNRADSSSLGSKWTQVSGTSAISSNQLSLSSATVTFTTPTGSASAAMVVSGKFTFTSAGTLSIYLLQNAGGYVRCLISLAGIAVTATGTANPVTGSITGTVSLSTSTQYSFVACAANGWATLFIYSADGSTFLGAAGGQTTILAASRSVSLNGNHVLVDDFKLRAGYDSEVEEQAGCPDCGHVYGCGSGCHIVTEPGTLEATLDLGGAISGSCGICGWLGDEYTFPFTSHGVFCTGSYNDPDYPTCTPAECPDPPPGLSYTTCCIGYSETTATYCPNDGLTIGLAMKTDAEGLCYLEASIWGCGNGNSAISCVGYANYESDHGLAYPTTGVDYELNYVSGFLNSICSGAWPGTITARFSTT